MPHTGLDVVGLQVRTNTAAQVLRGHGLPDRADGKRVMELTAMKDWVAVALKEPDGIDELDAEF